MPKIKDFIKWIMSKSMNNFNTLMCCCAIFYNFLSIKVYENRWKHMFLITNLTRKKNICYILAVVRNNRKQQNKIKRPTGRKGNRNVWKSQEKRNKKSRIRCQQVFREKRLQSYRLQRKKNQTLRAAVIGTTSSVKSVLIMKKERIMTSWFLCSWMTAAAVLQRF